MEYTSRYVRAAGHVAGGSDALTVAHMLRDARSLGIASAMGVTNLGGRGGNRGFTCSPEASRALADLEKRLRAIPDAVPAPTAEADMGEALRAERSRIANRFYAFRGGE